MTTPDPEQIAVRVIPSDFPRTASARFWSKVEVCCDTDCWTWRGGISSRGYGQFSIREDGGTITYKAHRLAFAFTHKRNPGPVLDHLCRNRRCCNPAHLEEVTPRENSIRGNGFAADNNRKSHCPSGHPLSGENLWIAKAKGRMWRVCLICKRAADKRWRDGKGRNIVKDQPND